MKEFKLYLETQGLKAGTVSDYIGRVLRVARAEKMTVDDLINNIVKVYSRYAKFGDREREGKISHESIRNSLKYLLKFSNSTKI